MPITVEDILILARSLKGLPQTQLHRIEVIAPMLGQAQLVELKQMLSDAQEKENQFFKEELEVRETVEREHVHYKKRKQKRVLKQQEDKENRDEMKEAEDLLNTL